MFILFVKTSQTKKVLSEMQSFSGKKKGISSPFFISRRKDYRIHCKHPHPQHLKETAGKDLHHIWYRILPLMKASNRWWFPLKALFCTWNNLMKTWR